MEKPNSNEYIKAGESIEWSGNDVREKSTQEKIAELRISQIEDHIREYEEKLKNEKHSDLKEMYEKILEEERQELKNIRDELDAPVNMPSVENSINEKEENQEINYDEIVEEKRKAYADGYKSFKQEEEGTASFFKKAYRKVAGHKYTMDELPPELKKLEEEYNDALANKGNKMYADQKEKLQEKKLSEKELKETLEKYINNEIFNEVVIKESERLMAEKVTGLPPKEKSFFRKGVEWYIKQPRTRKLIFSAAISTLLFTVMPLGGAASAAVIAGSMGKRLARGAFAGTIAQLSVKAYDWLVEDTTKEKRAAEEKELSGYFAGGEDRIGDRIEMNDDNIISGDTIKFYKDEQENILEKEQKRKRNRVLHKAMVAAGAGGIAAVEAGNFIGGLSHETVSSIKAPSQDQITAIKTKLHVEETDTIKPKMSVVDTSEIQEINTEEEVLSDSTGNPLDVAPTETSALESTQVEFSSRGAIQTINDMKHELMSQYPDISKAPASVQEFLKTNSTEEAIKLGFFDPGSEAESAMVAEGSYLEFDEKGNLLFHDMDTGETNTLISGDGSTLANEYHGKMFDAHEHTEVKNKLDEIEETHEEEILDKKLKTSQIRTGLEEEDLPAEKINTGEISANEQPGDYWEGKYKDSIPVGMIRSDMENITSGTETQAHVIEAVKDTVRYPGDSANKVLQRIIETNPELAEKIGWDKQSTLHNFAISASSGSSALLEHPELINRLETNEILQMFKFDAERAIWTPEKLSEEAQNVLLDKYFGREEFGTYLHGRNSGAWMDVKEIKATEVLDKNFKSPHPAYDSFIQDTKDLAKETGLTPKANSGETWEQFHQRLIMKKITQ